MWNRVQRNLPTLQRRPVASPQRRQCMRGLMASGRKKENDVFQEAKSQLVRIHPSPKYTGAIWGFFRAKLKDSFGEQNLMRLKIASVILLAGLVLAGCSKEGATASGGQQATVTLKDGTKFSGAVTANSNEAITLQGPGGESRTYPMAQVAGVKYDSVAPPVAAGGQQPAPTMTMASSAPKPSPVPAPVSTKTIAAGTTIEVRNNDTINSQTAQAGQKYSAVVAADVLDIDGAVAVPKGSNATLVVKSASDQGKVQGQSDLVVDLDSVEVGGRKYLVDTNDIVERGKQGIGTNKRTAIFTGGGAVLGGVIGAIAGGGKGAAIGTASGAAAGAGTQAVTRGKAVRIPSETLLHFRLDSAAKIREAR